MKRTITKTYCFHSNTMRNAYEIVHAVFDAYRGLPVKLASISMKSEEWFRSHGYKPKTEHPEANGNLSPVDHFMRYVRKFNAAEPGAGLMLSNRVHEALHDELSGIEIIDVSNADLACDVITESGDVSKWFIKFDIEDASRLELMAFERECNEAVDAIEAVKAKARMRIRMIELQRAA